MPTAAATAISKASTHFLQFRIQYASITLVWYDYALTFPAEVKYMWLKPFRISTLLYIFCRYALVANVLYLLAIAGKLTHGCDTWYQFIGAISVLGRAAVIVTFTGRTAAVWSRNRYILALLGSIGVLCFALDITHVPGLRCNDSSTIQIADTLLSILMCIFESLSAVLTTFRCVQVLIVEGSWRSAKSSFVYMVFEQGIAYFAIVSIFTTATAILNFRAPSGSFEERLPNAITLPLSCMLAARFLLRLRRWDSRLEKGHVSGQHGQGTTAGTVSGFVAATAQALSVSDFGEDPVAFHRAHGRLPVKLRAPLQSHSFDHDQTLNASTSMGEASAVGGGYEMEHELKEAHKVSNIHGRIEEAA